MYLEQPLPPRIIALSSYASPLVKRVDFDIPFDIRNAIEIA
jgi:hypothetical protein